MRMRKFYILSWGVMVLLFIVLACTLIKLYVEKETNLIETLKNGLEKNIDIYNQRTMNDTGNILSFSLDHLIVFRDRQNLFFLLSRKWRRKR